MPGLSRRSARRSEARRASGSIFEMGVDPMATSRPTTGSLFLAAPPGAASYAPTVRADSGICKRSRLGSPISTGRTQRSSTTSTECSDSGSIGESKGFASMPSRCWAKSRGYPMRRRHHQTPPKPMPGPEIRTPSSIRLPTMSGAIGVLSSTTTRQPILVESW